MELYINQIRVDLSNAIPFPLTFQISDIKDLSNRKGSSSKTIKLPGTKVNHELMSTVFALTTTDSNGATITASFDPSIKAKARYYQNGILQFEGIVKLTECVKIGGNWNFNIVLFSDQIDFVSLLSKIKIRELGWSEYDHTLNELNQVNSWDGIIQKNGASYNAFTGNNWNGEGYYYGLIDYGYLRTTANTFGVGQIPLQVFVKNIVDKMFEKVGVEYDSAFFETQQFKKLLLAYEGGVLPTIDEATAIAQSIETDQINFAGGKLIDKNIVGFTNPVGFEAFDFPFQKDEVYYHSDSGTNIDPSSQIQVSEPLTFVSQFKGDFKLNYSGTNNVVHNITLTNQIGSANVNATYHAVTIIYVNGVAVQTNTTWNNTINSVTLNNSFSAAFNLTFDLNLNVSDVVRVITVYTVWNSNVFVNADTCSLEYNVTSVSSALDLSFQEQSLEAGANINIKQFLPDMTCLDFFKGIINMFNLYMKPIPGEENKVYIEPLNDFYNGSNNSINWTSKLDESKEIKVTPTINFASKEYSFEYQDDKDFFNAQYTEDVTRQYGSKSVMSGSQLAKGETKIKLPFSNKLLAKIPNTDLIVPRNFQVKTDEDGISEVVSKRGKSFVVQIKKGIVGTMQTGEWIHVNELSVSTTRASYPYVGHLDDIDNPTFDLQFEIPDFVYYDITAGTNYTTNNLYIFHENFIRELIDRNGKMLSCSLRLNSNDINSLDFGDLINIDGVVYRLQKISDYNSNTDNSTKAELIRIIEGEGVQTYTTTIDENLYEKVITKKLERVIQFAVGDETTALSTGFVYGFRSAYDMTLTDVRGSLVEPGQGEQKLLIDVLVNSQSIYTGGTMLTFDAGETTTVTASVVPTIGRDSVLDDQKIQIKIINVDGENAATGLKMTIIGQTSL